MGTATNRELAAKFGTSVDVISLLERRAAFPAFIPGHSVIEWTPDKLALLGNGSD